MKNNYKTCFVFLALFTLQCMPLFMHSQVTTFQKVYETIVDQSGKDVLPTPDGGYIIVSTTENNIVNDFDILISKTNSLGDTLWTKAYPNPGLNYPNSIIEANGGYLILGYSQAPNADVDAYLLKINTVGEVLWSKVYGGYGNEDGKEIVPTADGNYVIIGASNSVNYTNNDIQLIKIDPAGNTIWTKYYGDPTAYESARSVKLCLDGGFILAGKTVNTVTTIATIYLIKTNSSGDTIWTKTIGGPNSYEGKFILTNSDGSYTLCADDSSAARDSDVKFIKMDENGTIIWDKTYGGTDKDICKMIQHTSDGGYIVAATSRSFGWANPDMWLLKLNALGDTAWTRNFGGIFHDHGYAVKTTSDGGYIAVGHNRNINSTFRIMLVKVNASGDFTPVSTEEFALANTLNIYPNPSNGLIRIDFGGDLTSSTFKIHNTLGQEVFSETINSSNQIDSRSIDLNGKEPGVYFLSIQSTTNSTTKKLILN